MGMMLRHFHFNHGFPRRCRMCSPRYSHVSCTHHQDIQSLSEPTSLLLCISLLQGGGLSCNLKLHASPSRLQILDPLSESPGEHQSNLCHLKGITAAATITLFMGERTLTGL